MKKNVRDLLTTLALTLYILVTIVPTICICPNINNEFSQVSPLEDDDLKNSPKDE